MYRYCIDKLHMSKATAFKRIRVARAAREFPSIFVAIEEGRIHLSGVLMLAPHLTRGNVGELLAAATHKTEPEIERLLAERFPRPDVPVRIESLVTPTEQIPQTTLASRRVESDAAVPEMQKCAATERPSTKQARTSRNARHIPAAVKRAVRKRDADRCTFMSDSGHRCDSRTQLEFDHIDAVARGGAATVGNIRLRCRAHNQLEAERTFGAGFMHGKRETARESRVRAATEASKYVERITRAAP